MCIMAGSEARPCVRGSLFHREVETVLDLVGSGQLSRSELEAALTADELKLVDDAGVATSQWYDIATVDKVMTLTASKSGLTLPEFCRMRGAKAAESLCKSGLYQQLEYLDRLQVSKASDPDSRVRAFGHDLRLLVSLSKNMFNFTEWSVRKDPDAPRRFQIEISQASDFGDIEANCTDGFINWAASKREQSRVWVWSRPVPDVVLFRMLLDA